MTPLLHWIRQLIPVFRMCSYCMRKLSDINPMHIDNFTSWQSSLGIKISEIWLLIQFWYLHWLGFLSGIDQMYLLLGLTYPFSRCIFGDSVTIEWVSSWLLTTRIADVNSFLTTLNMLIVKSLLVLRLRAIWDKNFIGERVRNMCSWARYIDYLNSSHANSILHDSRYGL